MSNFLQYRLIYLKLPLFRPLLPVKLTHRPHVRFFKLVLQMFEYRPVVNTPAFSLIQ